MLNKRRINLSNMEKRIIIVIVIAVIIFIVSFTLLYMSHNKVSKEEKKTSKGTNSNALSDEMNFYPDHINIDQELQDITIYNNEGKKIKLSDFRGKNVILLYWASWCKYCKKDFKYMNDYAEALKKYDDVEFILINKLDGKKETKQQAIHFLAENRIPFETYFDVDLKSFDELGIKIIPTFLGIDKKGILRICHPGNIDGADKFSSMIDYVRNGGSYYTEKFILEKMTSKAGGVHVNYYDLKKESPSGYDVLSESQGIMMEYAVEKKNKELFDHYFDFVVNHMMLNDSLAAWMLTGNGKANTNSLLDDLRIYRAIYNANQLWGGYDNYLKKWEANIHTFNITKSYPVDFYDFTYKKKASRITLCFLDLNSLKLLEKSDADYKNVYNNSKNIILNGYISDEFPLYYSWYDYKKNKYSKDDLNMSEAMLTLLHLAKQGKLKEKTIQWLEDKVETDGIKARYTTKGLVVDGYNYESTAIYACVAMIAKEIGNKHLMTLAAARMEQTRINDNSSKFNGAFSNEEGKDIFSYDQCLPLLTYSKIEK